MPRVQAWAWHHKALRTARVATVLAEIDQFGAVGDIAGVAEIANLEQAFARPVEQDEVKRRAARVVGIVHQHRRPPLDQPGDQLPVARLTVIAEVAAGLAAPGEARAVHYLDPDLV